MCYLYIKRFTIVNHDEYEMDGGSKYNRVLVWMVSIALVQESLIELRECPAHCRNRSL